MAVLFWVRSIPCFWWAIRIWFIYFFLSFFYRWMDVQIQCWAQIFFTLEGTREHENCSIFARGFENSRATTGQKSGTVLWSIYSWGMVCIFFFETMNNVLFTLNRTTHSSVLLLCVVRFNVNKTLLLKSDRSHSTSYAFQNYSKDGFRSNSLLTQSFFLWSQ